MEVPIRIRTTATVVESAAPIDTCLEKRDNCFVLHRAVDKAWSLPEVHWASEHHERPEKHGDGEEAEAKMQRVAEEMQEVGDVASGQQREDGRTPEEGDLDECMGDNTESKASSRKSHEISEVIFKTGTAFKQSLVFLKLLASKREGKLRYCTGFDQSLHHNVVQKQHVFLNLLSNAHYPQNPLVKKASLQKKL